jgi:DNA-binding transcriptional regulator YbjK
MTDEEATQRLKERYAAASPGRLANLEREWRQALGHPNYPEAADRLELIRAAQIDGVSVHTAARAVTA